MERSLTVELMRPKFQIPHLHLRIWGTIALLFLGITAAQGESVGGTPAQSAEKEPPAFSFADAPPEGFEDLAARQTTQVDVYFGGEMLINTMASFDLMSIEFINAEKITSHLTQLKDPDAITAAISGPLNPHMENLCLSNQQRDCGILTPGIAAIIFDADRFRVDLFINPFYLKTQTLQSRMFLPAAEKHLSSVNIFTANYSGGSELEQRSRLTSDSIISYGKTRLVSRASLQDSQGLILDTARLEHDQRKWSYALGTMDSSSLISPLATTRSFLGLRAARTLNTRTDLRLSEGNPVFIFLNERSRVDVLKDNKLVDSRFYEAGNQQLDTSRLPDGAYDITVRIANSRGEEQQTHFFTRSSLLPPQDHALHFLEAGTFLEENELDDLNKAPRTSDQSFVHAGSRLRIRDNLGAEIEGLRTSRDTALVQAGVYYFLPGLFLHGGALGGSEQTQGQFFNLSLGHRRFSLNLNYRDLESQQTQSEDTKSLFRAGSRTGLTLGTRIVGGSLLARVTDTDDPDFGTNTEYALNFRRSLFQRGGAGIDLTLDWKNNDAGDTLLVGLQFTGGNDKHRKFLATRWTDNGDDSILQADGRFTRFHRRNEEVFGSTTVYTLADKDQQSLGLRLDGDSRYGNGFLETQHQRQADTDSTIVSAGAQAVAITGASAMALGGSEPGRAGIIIDLGGKSQEEFEVRVDNRVEATAASNKKQPVLLQPYRSYDVTLNPKGDNLVRFDAKPKTVTLYPGNVANLHWDVDPVFVVIGQAVYADGKAVKNTRITNLEEFSATDENGWFQVELNKMKTLELQSSDGSDCRIELPEQLEYEDVIVFDQLVCA